MKSSGHSYTEGHAYEDSDVEDFGPDTTPQIVVKTLAIGAVVFLLGAVAGGLGVYHFLK